MIHKPIQDSIKVVISFCIGIFCLPNLSCEYLNPFSGFENEFTNYRSDSTPNNIITININTSTHTLCLPPKSKNLYRLSTSQTRTVFLSLSNDSISSMLTDSKRFPLKNNNVISLKSDFQLTISPPDSIFILLSNTLSFSAICTLTISIDSLEPNNTSSTATPLMQYNRSSYLSHKDQDCYSFSAKEGNYYYVNVENSTNSKLSVDTGNVSKLLNNVATNTGSIQAGWYCTKDGIYNCRLFQSDTSIVSFTKYQIYLTAVLNDSYEPDNSYEQATLIDVNAPAQTHSFISSDIDYFAFKAIAGTSYLIYAKNAGTINVDSSAEKMTIAYGLGTRADSACVTWNCMSSGTYYFRVSPLTKDTCRQNYVVAVKTILTDEYEPDGTYLQAKECFPAKIQSHYLTNGEEDWLFFKPKVGMQYSMRVSKDYDVKLYDSTLQLFGSLSYIDFGTGAQATWSNNDNQTIFICIKPKSNLFKMESYTILIKELSQSDLPKDSIVKIALPVKADGTLQAVDMKPRVQTWISFSAASGVSYLIDFKSSDSSFATLFSSDLSTVLDNQITSSGGPSTVLNCLSNGTYYVKLFKKATTSSSISITPFINDEYEPDNHWDYAKPISTNGEQQTHQFVAVADHIDYIKFDCAAGQDYTISTSSNVSFSVPLYRSDPEEPAFRVVQSSNNTMRVECLKSGPCTIDVYKKSSVPKIETYTISVSSQ